MFKHSYHEHLKALTLYRRVLLSGKLQFKYVAAGKGSNNNISSTLSL